ncbi:hypothetical protein WUBG_11119, partial [Wuchereria bancrofti]
SYYTFDLARLVVPKVFVDGIWQYVLNETAEYLVQYGYYGFSLVQYMIKMEMGYATVTKLS